MTEMEENRFIPEVVLCGVPCSKDPTQGEAVIDLGNSCAVYARVIISNMTELLQSELVGIMNLLRKKGRQTLCSFWEVTPMRSRNSRR